MVVLSIGLVLNTLNNSAASDKNSIKNFQIPTFVITNQNAKQNMQFLNFN
jgi:hypothetical protein